MRASTLQSAQHGLHVTPGAWRTSSSGVRLTHQTARQSRAGAFAQAVMERYKGRQIHWSSLDLVFTQRSPGLTVSPLYREVHMHMAPRLNLTIRGETHIRHQRFIEPVERALRAQLVHTVPGKTHIRHQRFIEPVERTLRAQFVHDLGMRGKRIEAVATQGRRPVRGVSMDPSWGARTDLPLGWPGSTVVRRPGTEFAPDNRGLSAAPATTQPWAREAAHAGADQVLSPLVPRTAPDEARLPLAPRRAAVIPHSPPDAQGAIAKLIEHTVQPGTLPGLELRLVSPEKQPSGTRRPAAVAQEVRQTTAAAPLQPPAPAAPSPSALDINAISEKVYDRLLRHQQLERARRGRY